MSLKTGTLPKAPSIFDRKAKNHGARYRNVVCATDTGASASKLGPSVSDRLLAKRRDETFKRVRMHTLAQRLRDRAPDESVYALGGEIDNGPTSTAHSVVESESGAQMRSEDIMILDLRPAEDFEKYHVHSARSYPKELLARDRISPELYAFKSAPEGCGKRLVVYTRRPCSPTGAQSDPQSQVNPSQPTHERGHDVDDKATAKVGAMLVEKGWSNIYVLSGGIEEVQETYPEYLEGEVPHTGGGGKSQLPERPSSSCSRLSNASRFTQMSVSTRR